MHLLKNCGGKWRYEIKTFTSKQSWVLLVAICLCFLLSPTTTSLFRPLIVNWAHFWSFKFIMINCNLINIWQMFNGTIEDLAMKPYIPNKSLLQLICCKCLGCSHRHSYFWPTRSRRLLEAKNTSHSKLGTLLKFQFYND